MGIQTASVRTREGVSRKGFSKPLAGLYANQLSFSQPPTLTYVDPTDKPAGSVLMVDGGDYWEFTIPTPTHAAPKNKGQISLGCTADTGPGSVVRNGDTVRGTAGIQGAPVGRELWAGFVTPTQGTLNPVRLTATGRQALKDHVELQSEAVLGGQYTHRVFYFAKTGEFTFGQVYRIMKPTAGVIRKQ